MQILLESQDPSILVQNGSSFGLFDVSDPQPCNLTEQFADLNTVLLLVLASAAQVSADILDDRSKDVVSRLKRGIRVSVGAVCGRSHYSTSTDNSRHLPEEPVPFVPAGDTSQPAPSPVCFWGTSRRLVLEPPADPERRLAPRLFGPSATDYIPQSAAGDQRTPASACLASCVLFRA